MNFRPRPNNGLSVLGFESSASPSNALLNVSGKGFGGQASGLRNVNVAVLSFLHSQ